MKRCSLNVKAINCLYCALSKDEFNRISMCSSTQEIWILLKLLMKEQIRLKSPKLACLIHNYELFKMDVNESIIDMFTRFTNIINALKGLGKVYTTSKNVRKYLRSLPKTWEVKMMAIQKAKDLTKLPLEELIGSLMIHEIIMKEHLEDESKKKKSIALKTISFKVDSKMRMPLMKMALPIFHVSTKISLRGRSNSRNTYQPEESQEVRRAKRMR